MRQRRLTRRGRLTIYALLALPAFFSGYALRETARAAWLSAEHGGDGGAGGVASNAPGGEDGAAPAPEWLLAKLPVSLADYRRADVVPASIEASSRAPIVHTIDGYSVEYSFDRALTGRVMKKVEQGRVEQGHIIVLDAETGRVLVYVSTDVGSFPPQANYPAASLVKVVTAAAVLDHDPVAARRPCLYQGNRYRLTPSRVHRPARGHEATLERALATSNNQCFAQLAVESLGSDTLVRAIESFGWLAAPAPGHVAGQVEVGEDAYDLGRLGCGLSGCRITPLHAAQLAATLARGEQMTPWWIDRVRDPEGRVLALPERPLPRRVISDELATELRAMLVRTTTQGTARRAFRDRRGRPKLGHITVAGKTGNLSGTEPSGRYEWFAGVAPAEHPTIAIAVLQLQGALWWSRSSEVAADVLQEIFCERSRCDASRADRFRSDFPGVIGPMLLSDASAGVQAPTSELRNEPASR